MKFTITQQFESSMHMYTMRILHYMLFHMMFIIHMYYTFYIIFYSNKTDHVFYTKSTTSFKVPNFLFVLILACCVLHNYLCRHAQGYIAAAPDQEAERLSRNIQVEGQEFLAGLTSLDRGHTL